MKRKHVIIALVIVMLFCITYMIIRFTIRYNTNIQVEPEQTSYIDETSSSVLDTSYSNEVESSNIGLGDIKIDYETKSDNSISDTEIDMSSSETKAVENLTSDIDWSNGELYQSQINSLLDIVTNLLHVDDETIITCYIASSDEVVNNNMLNGVGYFVDEDGTLYLNIRIVHVDNSVSFRTVGLYYDTNIICLREE